MDVRQSIPFFLCAHRFRFCRTGLHSTVYRDYRNPYSIARLCHVDSTWPSNPDAALRTFVTEFQRQHFELDETVCEQGFEFWVDAASKFIPMLMRGTDRSNGIEPLGYRPGYALMWALIEDVFFGDERAAVIAEVAKAFGEALAERLEATNPPEHAVLRHRVAGTPYVGLYRFSSWALADVTSPFILTWVPPRSRNDLVHMSTT